jgi:hypothetical protein
VDAGALLVENSAGSFSLLCQLLRKLQHSLFRIHKATTQVELIYLDLNFRFDICIIFMINCFLVRNDISVDSETLLVINFMNLKIKLTQSFKYVHKYRMCVHVFIGMSTHTCIRICVYKKKDHTRTMVLKKQSTYEQCNQAPVNTKIQLGITREADLFTLYSIPYFRT